MKLKKRKIEYTGQENHSITRAEFNDFIENHRGFFSHIDVEAGFIDKESIFSLLTQPGVKGIRYHYACDDSSALGLVVTAGDRNGNDILGNQDPCRLLPAAKFRSDDSCDEWGSECRISLGDAAAGTAAYRQNGFDGQPRGGFFARNIIESLLLQDNCSGLCFFYGATAKGQRVICLSGIDKAGRYMLDGRLGELSHVCPPFCPEPNILNSEQHYQQKLNFISI